VTIEPTLHYTVVYDEVLR